MPKFSARSLSHTYRFQGPFNSFPMIHPTTAGCFAARTSARILVCVARIDASSFRGVFVPSSKSYPTTMLIPYREHKSKKCVCLCEYLSV